MSENSTKCPSKFLRVQGDVLKCLILSNQLKPKDIQLAMISNRENEQTLTMEMIQPENVCHFDKNRAVTLTVNFD